VLLAGARHVDRDHFLGEIIRPDEPQPGMRPRKPRRARDLWVLR
jgi:hypothetical protein